MRRSPDWRAGRNSRCGAKEKPAGHYKRGPFPVSRKSARDDRIRDDREAGRLRFAPDPDDGELRRDQRERRDLPDNRAQMVFLGAASDGFYTLAQTKSGVTCLFAPGFLPMAAPTVPRPAVEGQVRQPSNASREVSSTRPGDARRRGRTRDPGNPVSRASHPARLRGRLGRVDAAGADTGIQPHIVAEGFGSSLADLPMMTNVLANLAIDTEAATLCRISRQRSH